MLDEQYLRVREYTNGNYYSHYAKLMGAELSDITDRINYLEDPSTINYITQELSNLGALGGYNEELKKEVIINIIEAAIYDESLTYMDLYAVADVVSKLGDFAINSINTPILDWFEKDLTIRNTWLDGGTHTLRHDFKGSLDNSKGREFTIYFSELPDNKYEILNSRILTYGISFDVYGYTLGGVSNLLNTTLFTKGGGRADSPSNILAYVSVAYRDTNGNVIYTKGGNLATPMDSVRSRVVYSGTSPNSVTETIIAQMGWTQLSGYRYKGYLLKYGGGGSGYYGIYNNPSEMTVTTNSAVSVTSSFSYPGLRHQLSILF